MTRAIGCVLLLCASAASASAQTQPTSGAGRGATGKLASGESEAGFPARRDARAPAGERKFGVRAGANVATIAADPDDGAVAFEARTGLVAGVFATWRALSWLEVQPEVLFTSKGAALEEEGIDAELVLDYIEVPLLARISKRMPRVTVYAAAGPALAWRLAAKSRTAFSGATEEIDLADEVEPFDLGMAAGGGLEAGRWVVDVRYTLGLRDIDADTSDAVTIKTRALSLSAGIRF